MAEEKERYWTWTGDELIDLGLCEDFDEAAEKTEQMEIPCVWIFGKESLETFHRQIDQLNPGGKI